MLKLDVLLTKDLVEDAPSSLDNIASLFGCELVEQHLGKQPQRGRPLFKHTDAFGNEWSSHSAILPTPVRESIA